jgi:phosphonoacetaldehyde hydrolase
MAHTQTPLSQRRKSRLQVLSRRSYRGPLRAVLLDWAGTTIDYGCLAPAAGFMKVFEDKGVPITVAEARAPMGLHKQEHLGRILKGPRVSRHWKQVHGRRPNAQDAEAMFEEFVPRQLQCLAQHADLIPGTLEAVAEFRRRGLKIGSTTGYTEEMVAVLAKEASRRGYRPDSIVCATQVPAGRPHPYMCFQNALNLGTYPMEAFVKIGDTVPDIEEGLNAGAWTIGVAKTGNELGLTAAQIAAMKPELVQRKLARAYERLARAGAHYVVDSIAEVVPLLDKIGARLGSGDRP